MACLKVDGLKRLTLTTSGGGQPTCGRRGPNRGLVAYGDVRPRRRPGRESVGQQASRQREDPQGPGLDADPIRHLGRHRARLLRRLGPAEAARITAPFTNTFRWPVAAARGAATRPGEDWSLCPRRRAALLAARASKRRSGHGQAPSYDPAFASRRPYATAGGTSHGHADTDLAVRPSPSP